MLLSPFVLTTPAIACACHICSSLIFTYMRSDVLHYVKTNTIKEKANRENENFHSLELAATKCLLVQQHLQSKEREHKNLVTTQGFEYNRWENLQYQKRLSFSSHSLIPSVRSHGTQHMLILIANLSAQKTTCTHYNKNWFFHFIKYESYF